MNFKTAIKTCLKEKYFTFRGRASRSEYWLYYLFTLLLFTFMQTISAIILFSMDVANFSSTILILVVLWSFFLACLGFIIPNISVAARRLHDIDRSGWWQLIVLIPVVGIVIFFVFTTKKGTEGKNRFGSPVLDTEEIIDLVSVQIVK